MTSGIGHHNSHPTRWGPEFMGRGVSNAPKVGSKPQHLTCQAHYEYFVSVFDLEGAPQPCVCTWAVVSP